MGLTDEVRRNAREIAERARFVSIDIERLDALDPGRPPEAHFIAGSAEEVAHFVLVLDTINFGSGWFPTLRKRPGMSGYLTVESSLADFWRVLRRVVRSRTTGIDGGRSRRGPRPGPLA